MKVTIPKKIITDEDTNKELLLWMKIDKKLKWKIKVL